MITLACPPWLLRFADAMPALLYAADDCRAGAHATLIRYMPLFHAAKMLPMPQAAFAKIRRDAMNTMMPLLRYAPDALRHAAATLILRLRRRRALRFHATLRCFRQLFIMIRFAMPRHLIRHADTMIFMPCCQRCYYFHDFLR